LIGLERFIAAPGPSEPFEHVPGEHEAGEKNRLELRDVRVPPALCESLELAAQYRENAHPPSIGAGGVGVPRVSRNQSSIPLEKQTGTHVRCSTPKVATLCERMRVSAPPHQRLQPPKISRNAT
jgi:hypothetical protein